MGFILHSNKIGIPLSMNSLNSTHYMFFILTITKVSCLERFPGFT